MLIPVVLYTRRNCPLCADAEALLSEFGARFPLALELRDVDSNAEWRQTFGQEVPVVFLGPRKLFRYRIDAAQFEDALVAYDAGADNGDHT